MRKGRTCNWHTLILVIGCMALNLCASKLALGLRLPLFLDSVGTILAAALGGYFPGIIVGFFSNYINSISDPISLYYGVLSIMIAVLSAFLSGRGAFKKPGGLVLSALAFAAIGGALGSLMTWALYGLNFGSGISAPFAISIYESGVMSKFWSQFTADICIDVLDKFVTVIVVAALLHLLPRRFTDTLPLGGMYAKTEKKKAAKPEKTEKHSGTFGKAGEDGGAMRFSIKHKIAALIIISAVVLSSTSVTISYILYERTMTGQYEELGSMALSMMEKVVNGNEIDRYLSTCETDERYYEINAKLEAIRDSIPDIEYLYIARDMEDGSHVVFDLDTEDVKGSTLGDVWDFDKTFIPYIPQLIAGEEIDPVISNDQYGWLLTVRRPVTNSDGEFSGYLCADIKMQDVISDRYVYIIRVVSLLFGASTILVAFTLWFSQKRFAEPLQKLTESASSFAYDSGEHRKQNIAQMQQLNIKTGDEIEELYQAMKKTTADVDTYITLIAEKNADVAAKAAFIAQMQDNIIFAFADMIENRDELTGSHIRRTAAYVEAIAKELAKDEKYADRLTPEYISLLTKSAPLHDIGKVKVPDAILNKPGRLTPEEFARIKEHTTAGRGILENALKNIEGGNYLSIAMEMAYSHHERWDGRGYPEGLSGEEIPLSARIMALADVLDALVSRRSYKEAYPFDEAAEIIVSESAAHFDPDVVKAFLRIKEEARKISES